MTTVSACEKMVATAAPLTPMSKRDTRMMSRMMLHTHPDAMQISGMAELPNPLKMAAKALKITTKSTP